MSHASRLTMIPLAAMSALLLMPQVTMASSLSQQHYQQHYQQQLKCSAFRFVLPTSETGLAGRARVIINPADSSNPVSVKVPNNGTLTAVSGVTYTGGVLKIPGAINTFTISSPPALKGIVVTPTSSSNGTTGTPFLVHAKCLPGSTTVGGGTGGTGTDACSTNPSAIKVVFPQGISNVLNSGDTVLISPALNLGGVVGSDSKSVSVSISNGTVTITNNANAANPTSVTFSLSALNSSSITTLALNGAVSSASVAVSCLA